jgi:hypothetical protein
MSDLPPAPPPPPPGFEQYPASGLPRTHGKATAALVCGIVGLFLCPIILSIVAIVLGTSAQKEIRASGGALTGEGLAKAGFVLGIVGLALGALWLILALATA